MTLKEVLRTSEKIYFGHDCSAFEILASLAQTYISLLVSKVARRYFDLFYFHT